MRGLDFKAGAIAVAFALAACAKLAGLENADEPETLNGASLVTPEGIIVSPAKLEFATRCSDTAQDQYVSISNTSDKEVPYEVRAPERSVISLRDDQGVSGPVVSGVLAPGKVVQVVVVVTASKPGTMTSEIFVTTAGRLQQIPTQVTIKGGALTLTPALIDFGEVRQNTPAPSQPVEIENIGSEPVTVRSWSSSATDAGTADFTMSTGSITIAPGQKGTASASFVPGGAGEPVSVELRPDTVDSLCSEAPKLTLKGRRVNQDVTVNPGSVDFGDVDCKATSDDVREVVFSNYANSTATASITLPDSSWFKVTTATQISVPAAAGSSPGTATIKLGLKQMPSQLEDHSEDISIDITSPVKTTKIVKARVNTVGAILSITPTTLDGFYLNQTRQFSIKNDGNKSIFVHLNNSNPNVFRSPTTDVTLFTGFFSTKLVDLKFTPFTFGTYTATITATPNSGALCNAPPVLTATAKY